MDVGRFPNILAHLATKLIPETHFTSLPCNRTQPFSSDSAPLLIPRETLNSRCGYTKSAYVQKATGTSAPLLIECIIYSVFQIGVIEQLSCSERIMQIRAYTQHLMQMFLGKIIKEMMFVLVHKR